MNLVGKGLAKSLQTLTVTYLFEPLKMHLGGIKFKIDKKKNSEICPGLVTVLTTLFYAKRNIVSPHR